MLRIGGHVSTQGGLLTAIKEAERIGANTIQIFGASPVQWKAPLPDEGDVARFKAEIKKHDIGPVFLHAPYLVNLASPKGNMARISEALLERHLEISNFIGADGVIFHIGSRGDRPQKEAEKLVATELKDILNRVKEGRLLIENSAGAGNLVGDQLEEVGAVVRAVDHPRLGFCLDTAHAFEAGIFPDFSKNGVEEFYKKIERYVGTKKLWAVHLNDSKTPTGSNKDRHENIGEGLIGSEGFKNFLSHREFGKLPLILEVPGFDDKGADRRNIELVRKIAEK